MYYELKYKEKNFHRNEFFKSAERNYQLNKKVTIKSLRALQIA